MDSLNPGGSQSIFHGFYQKLKSPQAAPVRKSIELFVRTTLPKIIKNDCSREEQGERVQELMTEMTETFMEIFPPKENGQPGGDEQDDWALNGEGIENCVMKNLFQDLFKHPNEQEFNKNYVRQTLLHQRFLKPEHLDLPTGEKSRIDQVRVEHAVQQLLQLNKYKTPKAKLTMLINFCRVISIMLQETSPDGQPDGADMFFPACIYSFLQIEEKQILQDLNTNIQFVKHFRHQDRLSGEDEYYLTTLESVVEFIHGVSHKDLKMEESVYKNHLAEAEKSINDEKRAREEAAQMELADLLDMTGSTNNSSHKRNDTADFDKANKKDKKKTEKLSNVDKVYSEMKSKNKKLKKELQTQKEQTESLRSIFAEFQVEFRQNKKHEKLFEQLTISDLQDIFAIQQKLMAQIESLNIGSVDLQNQNWAEFDMMEQQDNTKEPMIIPTTQQQQEVIRMRAENSRSRSRKARQKNKAIMLNNQNIQSNQNNNSQAGHNPSGGQQNANLLDF